MNYKVEETIMANDTEQFGISDESNMKPDSTSAKSEELKKLFHVLAITYSNAVFRVFSKENEKERNEQAVSETNRLIPLNRGGKCPQGMVFNEITGRCE